MAAGCSDLVETVSIEDRKTVTKAVETLIAPDVLVRMAKNDVSVIVSPSPSPTPSPSDLETFELSDRYDLQMEDLWTRPLDYYFHEYEVASWCISRKYSAKYGSNGDSEIEKSEIDKLIFPVAREMAGIFFNPPQAFYSNDQIIRSPLQQRAYFQGNLDRLRLLGMLPLLGLVKKVENLLPKKYYESLPAYRDLNSHLATLAEWIQIHKPKTSDEFLSPEVVLKVDTLFDDLVGTIQGFHEENLSTYAKLAGFTTDYTTSKTTYSLSELLSKFKALSSELKQLGRVMDREFKKRYEVVDPFVILDHRNETRAFYDYYRDLGIYDLALIQAELKALNLDLTSISSKSTSEEIAVTVDLFCKNPLEIYQKVSAAITAEDPTYYPSEDARSKLIDNVSDLLELLGKFPLQDVSNIPLH